MRTRALYALPGLLVALSGVALIAWGPIAQLPHYHDFADTRSVAGIPHAADVLSSLAFALVGAWAMLRARGAPDSPQWAAECMFHVALLLTAAGSAYYHWAPDNARLVYDRIPIAMACASLICAMHARVFGARIPGLLPALLAAAVASVLWWSWTEGRGRGDLRPYLLLQAAPLVLVPLWQWLHGAPRRERLLVAIAVVLYVAAKGFETEDAAVLAATGAVSGHTLKHLVAAVASAALCKAMRP